MVRYVDESVVPIPRDRLWRLLDQHAREGEISRIHPEVVSQQTVSQGPGELVVKRGVRMFRRVVNATWKISFMAPERYRWEILDGNGPWAAGSYLANQYSDAPGGTLVRTEAELTVVGLPGFLQNRIVRLVLGRIDGEDLDFLSKNP